MRIVYFDEENSVKFLQIESGCVFYYKGNIYMKMRRYGSGTFNSVVLEDGKQTEFSDNTYVLPLDARLIIEKGAIE